MKEKIISIEWDDACYNTGYYDAKDPESYSQLRTKTVGHLIKSNSKEITVGTDSWHPSGRESTQYRHITTIPKKMIKKISILKE